MQNNNKLRRPAVANKPQITTQRAKKKKKKSNVGHSHKPYHRILESSAGVFKHVINLGSVGKPKDRDTRGCYVMLTTDKNSSVLDPESIKVKFRRVAYDLNMTTKGILESSLPDEFAQVLIEAR